MEKFQDTIRDQAGRGVSYGIATVTNYPSGTAATLYSDDGVTLISGNSVTADAIGRFSFYAANGTYSVAYSGTNIVTYTYNDIVLFDPADSTASADIGFIAAGTGAVATTVQEKERRKIDIFDKLTASEKAAVTAYSYPDVAAAFANAMTDFGTAPGELILQPGGYLIGSMITVPDNVNITGPKSAIVRKGFNGDMMTLGAKCTLSGFYMDGNGATYTGRGVVISTGAVDPFPMTTNVYWRRLLDMDIINTASYCVEFTTASAGYGSLIRGGRMVPYNNTSIAAVKYPAVEASNGNRSMHGVFTGSNTLVDLGGSDNSQTIGCQGGQPTFSSTTKKAIVSCNRLSGSGATWTIDGSQHVVTGNVDASPTVVFASTLSGCLFQNYMIGTVTDNSTGMTSGNEIYYGSQTGFTPSWTGGSPSIGNGTLSCAYSRRGTYVNVDITLQIGSTTTVGSGAWTFTLPFTPNRTSVGRAYIVNNAGTTIFSGAFRITAGSASIQIVTSNSSTAFVGSAQPFAWATGDQMTLTATYQIQ